jgi:hypothetical protein
MARRGQCRCGTILLFHKTARGFKTRCPQCGAIVRLRVEQHVRQGHRSSGARSMPGEPPPLPVSRSVAAPSVVTLDDLPGPTGPNLLEDDPLGRVALAEMEAYPGPEPAVFPLRWWLFGVAALVVVLGVVVATILWE